MPREYNIHLKGLSTFLTKIEKKKNQKPWKFWAKYLSNQSWKNPCLLKFRVLFQRDQTLQVLYIILLRYVGLNILWWHCLYTDESRICSCQILLACIFYFQKYLQNTDGQGN